MRTLLFVLRRAFSLAACFVAFGLAGCTAASHASRGYLLQPPLRCVRGTLVDLTTGVAFSSADFAAVDAPIVAANLALRGPIVTVPPSGFRLLATPDDAATPRRQYLFEIHVLGPEGGARRVLDTITTVRSNADLRAVMALAVRARQAELERFTSRPSGSTPRPPPSRSSSGQETVVPIATDEEIARLERSRAEFRWEPTPGGRTTLPLQTPGDGRALRLTLQLAPSHTCQHPVGLLARN